MIAKAEKENLDNLIFIHVFNQMIVRLKKKNSFIQRHRNKHRQKAKISGEGELFTRK